MEKLSTKPIGHDEAKQVFRQFAWNLAGKLAGAKPTQKTTRTKRTTRRVSAKRAVGK